LDTFRERKRKLLDPLLDGQIDGIHNPRISKLSGNGPTNPPLLIVDPFMIHVPTSPVDALLSRMSECVSPSHDCGVTWSEVRLSNDRKQ